MRIVRNLNLSRESIILETYKRHIYCIMYVIHCAQGTELLCAGTGAQWINVHARE